MDNVAAETRRLIDNLKADSINERKRSLELLQRQNEERMHEEIQLLTKTHQKEIQEVQQRARDSQLQALQGKLYLYII